jgi:predicted acetyltransferase
VTSLRLRPLRPADERQARRAHDELRAEGFTFLLGWEPALGWPAYLARLEERSRGTELPDRWVPSTFLVAEVDGALVGRASIRHRLDKFLLTEGGHIGYAVRPAHRRRGYATEILRQALLVARAAGVEDALITCDEDNAASVSVIERLGGRLEDVRDVAAGAPKRRYWIR